MRQAVALNEQPWQDRTLIDARNHTLLHGDSAEDFKYPPTGAPRRSGHSIRNVAKALCAAREVTDAEVVFCNKGAPWGPVEVGNELLSEDERRRNLSTPNRRLSGMKVEEQTF